jgi:hypothetical protein
MVCSAGQTEARTQITMIKVSVFTFQLLCFFFLTAC